MRSKNTYYSKERAYYEHEKISSNQIPWTLCRGKINKHDATCLDIKNIGGKALRPVELEMGIKYIMKNPIKFTKIPSGSNKCVICGVNDTDQLMWKGINTGQEYCDECKTALEEDYFVSEVE